MEVLRMKGNNEKDLEMIHVTAQNHPKALDANVLILNLVMCVIGAIIGLELLVRTGVTPNTSIVGALFAIILSRIPIKFFQKYRSIHSQNLIQTAISGATFSAANCMLLPIGIPVVMGRPELMFPMLIGVFMATIIDATILYKTFDTEMFPASGAWAPGVAAAQTITAVVEKGRKAMLLLVGMGLGIGGKIAGLPMDLLGVSWFGNVGAMAALGIGSLVIGVLKTNMFSFSVFGANITLATNIFGEGADIAALPLVQYMPHGIMIGAGVVALIQVAVMLFAKKDGSDSAANQFSNSMLNMKRSMGWGYVAYLASSLVLAVICGLWHEMSILMFVAWLVYTAFAAIASELIVGISAMHSGWFPGFATALIFLLVGMLMGFPAVPLAIMVGYTSATGPAFSDMAYDLKCGYMLRGNGADPELEKVGRKQQYISEMISFCVAFAMVALLANRYFDQGLFAPVSKTFVTTIEAGASAEVAKYLLLWAIPGAIIQFLGGHRQIGILFATGLLVGSTVNGVTIIVALAIRLIVVRINKDNEQILNILGAGALAGAALYSFFTATLQLGKKKV